MDKSQLKIVFFGSSLEVGGAELHTIRLRAKLARLGYPTDLILLGSKRSEALMQMPGAEQALFLHIRGLSVLGGWIKTWRLFRKIDPDIIIAINQTPLVVAIILRFFRGTRAKIGCIFHSTEMQKFEKRFENALIILSPYCDFLIYVSNIQKNIWTACGVKPRFSETIFNGVEIDDYVKPATSRSDIRKKFAIADTDYLLGHVAVFRDEKNHMELVEAVAVVRERGQNVKALLIGDGPTLADVKAKVMEKNLTDIIFFAGEQTDVSSYMHACDAGVICSTIETFPLAVLEFLACGVPIISSNVGGAPEIIQSDYNGLLYTLGRIDEFADCIAVMSDHTRRAQMAANARASIQHHSFSEMTRKYMKLIQYVSQMER